MSAFRLSLAVFLGFNAAFGLSSCTNPESETPVALTPGLYAVQVGSFGKAKDQLCFTNGDDQNVNRLIKKYYAFLEEGCSHKTDARVGNRVSGTISCEIDTTSGFKTTYEGSLTTDSITVDATIVNYAPALGSDEREEKTTESRLTARRIGPCT